MGVSELKSEMRRRNTSFKGMVEKSEFVDTLTDLYMSEATASSADNKASGAAAQDAEQDGNTNMAEEYEPTDSEPEDEQDTTRGFRAKEEEGNEEGGAMSWDTLGTVFSAVFKMKENAREARDRGMQNETADGK